MIDPNQRQMNWQIKTDTGRMKETLDTLRPDMLKRFEAAVVSLCEMETKARQTLNAAGVHTIMCPVPQLRAATLQALATAEHLWGELCAECSGPARQVDCPRPAFRRPRPNPDRSLRCRRSRAISRGLTANS